MPQAGGGVITMPGENLLFAESNAWSMGGVEKSRPRTFEMEPDYLISNESLGEINLPNHPLVDGLGAFSGTLEFFTKSKSWGHYRSIMGRWYPTCHFGHPQTWLWI